MLFEPVKVNIPVVKSPYTVAESKLDVMSSQEIPLLVLLCHLIAEGNGVFISTVKEVSLPLHIVLFTGCDVIAGKPVVSAIAKSPKPVAPVEIILVFDGTPETSTAFQIKSS